MIRSCVRQLAVPMTLLLQLSLLLLLLPVISAFTTTSYQQQQQRRIPFVPSLRKTTFRWNIWWSSQYRPNTNIYTAKSTRTTTSTTTLQQQSSDDLTNSINRMIGDVSSTIATNTSFQYHHLNNIERIFCLSDLHTDHIDNLLWLQQNQYAMVTGTVENNNNHNNIDTTNDRIHYSKIQSTDLIIIAGDISHQISTFQETMSVLLNQYQCQVLFVPGNHEAWLSTSSLAPNDAKIVTSFDKLQQIYDVCRTMGVLVDPVYISSGTCEDDTSTTATTTAAAAAADHHHHHHGHPVWILPLQSWYDGTLTFDEPLCEGFEKWPWMDFIKCQWDPQRFVPSTSPHNARIPQGLVEYFLQCNQDNIIVPFQRLLQEQPQLVAPCITVSHFAPNQQCLPDWKNVSESQFNVDAWLDHGAGTMSAKFAKVAGTKQLDEQIRTLLPLRKNPNNTTRSTTGSDMQWSASSSDTCIWSFPSSQRFCL